MSELCKHCKQPFVSTHFVAVLHGNAREIHLLCPDCRENMGRFLDDVGGNDYDESDFCDDYSEESYP